VRLRLRNVPDLEIKEGEALQCARVIGRDAQRHVPFVERALVVVLVGEDAGKEIVGIGVVRMPLETRDRDAMGEVELSFAAQQLAQPEEDEARRILSELRRELPDVVKHASRPARRLGPARLRAHAAAARARGV